MPKTTYAAVGASNPFLGLASSFGEMAASSIPGFGSGGLDTIMSGLNAKTLTLRDLSGRKAERALLDTAAILKQLDPDAVSAAQAQATALTAIKTAEAELSEAQKTLSAIQIKVIDAIQGVFPPEVTNPLAYLMDLLTDFNNASDVVQDKERDVQTLWDGVSGDFQYAFTDNRHIVTYTVIRSGSEITVTLTFDRAGKVVGYTCNDSDVYTALAVLYFDAASASGYSALTAEPIVDSPAIANSISVYPVDFDQKELVLAYLDAWNGDDAVTFTRPDGSAVTIERDDRSDITYSDILSLIFEIIGIFIDMITIALICFTSLSLVVSTVMIAIITYVSVVERIKEIGVIRSLGGRKRDVSRLFNAETIIIGLIAGIIGILFTLFASWIINLIVNSFQPGLGAIAVFPWFYALLMLGVSVALTLISGLLPSRSAAKKDPVIALRSE